MSIPTPTGKEGGIRHATGQPPKAAEPRHTSTTRRQDHISGRKDPTERCPSSPL